MTQNKPDDWIEQDSVIYPNPEAAYEASKINLGPKYWTDKDGKVYMGLCFMGNLIKEKTDDGK